MTDEELIEEVARRMWYDRYGKYRPGKDTWPDDVVGGAQDIFREHAKSAVEQLRRMDLLA